MVCCPFSSSNTMLIRLTVPARSLTAGSCANRGNPRARIWDLGKHVLNARDRAVCDLVGREREFLIRAKREKTSENCLTHPASRVRCGIEAGVAFLAGAGTQD
jgi:hypothetical protein